MKCFIHINDDAIAVCKKCGKAMCGNCSAYTNHSGICPECKREEYIQERYAVTANLDANKRSTVLSVVLAVLIAVVAVVLAIILNVYALILLFGSVAFGIRILVLINRRKPFMAKLEYLNNEINTLNNALQRNRAII